MDQIASQRPLWHQKSQVSQRAVGSESLAGVLSDYGRKLATGLTDHGLELIVEQCFSDCGTGSYQLPTYQL